MARNVYEFTVICVIARHYIEAIEEEANAGS
jgi:hypothetical protein